MTRLIPTAPVLIPSSDVGQQRPQPVDLGAGLAQLHLGDDQRAERDGQGQRPRPRGGSRRTADSERLPGLVVSRFGTFDGAHCLTFGAPTGERATIGRPHRRVQPCLRVAFTTRRPHLPEPITLEMVGLWLIVTT